MSPEAILIVCCSFVAMALVFPAVAYLDLRGEARRTRAELAKLRAVVGAVEPSSDTIAARPESSARETNRPERDDETVDVFALDNDGDPVPLHKGASRSALLAAVGLNSTGDPSPAQCVIAQLQSEIRAVVDLVDTDATVDRQNVARLLEGYASRLDLADELSDTAQNSSGRSPRARPATNGGKKNGHG